MDQSNIEAARSDLVEAREHLDEALERLNRTRGTLGGDAEERLQALLRTLYDQRAEIVGALNELDQASGATSQGNVKPFGPRRMAD